MLWPPAMSAWVSFPLKDAIAAFRQHPGEPPGSIQLADQGLPGHQNPKTIDDVLPQPHDPQAAEARRKMYSIPDMQRIMLGFELDRWHPAKPANFAKGHWDKARKEKAIRSPPRRHRAQYLKEVETDLTKVFPTRSAPPGPVWPY